MNNKPVVLFSYLLAILFVVGLFFIFLHYPRKSTKVINMPVVVQNSVIPTPINSGTTSPSWKTYTNVKYGFEITYPKSGQLQNPSRTGECGLNITEMDPNTASPYVAIDNFFGVFSLKWNGTIADYLKKNDPSGVTIHHSIKAATADEAIQIDGYDQNKLTEGYPPLAYVNYVFRKGDHLIYLAGFQNTVIENGCVSYDKSLKWNIPSSFKFHY